jgi:hypothetical protein
MRFISRADQFGDQSNVFPMRPNHVVRRDGPELTAFRGLLIAASLSALFWGVCATAVWLLRSRT